MFLNTSNVGIIIKYTTLAYADKIGKKKENYNNEKKLYLLKIDGRILLILRKKIGYIFMWETSTKIFRLSVIFVFSARPAFS